MNNYRTEAKNLCSKVCIYERKHYKGYYSPNSGDKDKGGKGPRGPKKPQPQEVK